MGSKSDKTQTQEASPWGGQQPYLQDLFRQGQAQFHAGPQQYYPGATVAPFSPQTQMAMDMTTQRALGGDPSQQAFGNWLTGTLGQPNLNPYQIAQGYQGAAGGVPQAQQMLAGGGAELMARDIPGC